MTAKCDILFVHERLRQMSDSANTIVVNGDYAAWIESLSARYRESQIKAAVAVNTEMLKFYFSLGRDITFMEKDQPWGSGFLKRVSFDLKRKMPEAGCFSPRNLYYMRDFFKLYAGEAILHQVGAKLSAENITSPQVGANLDFQERPQLVDSISPQVGDELDSPIFHVPWGHHKYLIDKFLLELGRGRERPSEYRRHRIRSVNDHHSTGNRESKSPPGRG